MVSQRHPVMAQRRVTVDSSASRIIEGALSFKVGLLNRRPRSARFTAWSLALKDRDSGRTGTRSAVSGSGRKHMLEIDQDSAKGFEAQRKRIDFEAG